MYNSQETIFRIKQRAKEQGIAILDLQAKCDLGRNAISQAAKSQDGMKARNLFAIAEVLNCSVDYLLGRTDNPTVSGNNISNVKTTITGTQANVIQETDTDLYEIKAILSKLSNSKRHRAIADVLDLLEEEYINEDDKK
jgi:transcriptional regulator with XRE-family HTH domain